MDFIETLMAIVKEVIKEPCQTIEKDRIESLVKRCDNYRDFTIWALYMWLDTQAQKYQAEIELLARLKPLEPEFEKLRVEKERIKTENDPLNIIIKELRELKEQNKLILKELQANSSLLEK